MNIKLFEEFSEEERQKLIITHKTYLKKNKVNNIIEYSDILIKIKNYDFTKLHTKFNGFEVIITSDEEFKKLLSELNELIKDKVDINFNFSLTIDKDRLNSINLDSYLPMVLRGLNIGYKIYKLMINNFDFITSDYGVSSFSNNIWYKLICDSDYYAFTSNICSGVIKKDLTDDRLKIILDNIKNNVYKIYQIEFENLELDSKLKDKIKKIWK